MKSTSGRNMKRREADNVGDHVRTGLFFILVLIVVVLCFDWDDAVYKTMSGCRARYLMMFLSFSIRSTW